MTPRDFPFGFSIGNKGYIGCGRDAGGSHLYDFWEWDQTTNVWTQKANYGGGGIAGEAAFSVNGKGYAGGGFAGGTSFSEFHEYDPITNIWTRRQDIPGTPRQMPFAFVIGNNAYLGGGGYSLGYHTDFYEWDEVNLVWIARAPIPGNGRTEATAFSSNGKGYMVGGFISPGLVNTSDVFEYNPTLNQWTIKNNYPSIISLPFSFNIGNKGFVGGGNNGSGYVNAFYEYDQTNDTWIPRASFGGGIRGVTAAHFGIGNYGYVSCGSGSSLNNDLWEYNPSAPSVTANFSNTNNGQTFNFTNTSTNGVTYSWDFGDGSNSTSASPSHTYNVGGTYTVCLTATNGCVSDQHCSTVTFGCANPVAAFSSSTSGLTANFTNTSTNGTSYSWNFGDGNNATTQNASHVYNNTGTYTVTLTVTNGCGSSTITHTVSVNCVAPTASYNFNVSGMTASFSNTSPNAANSIWDFGDVNSGASNSSLLNSPSHVFSSPGLYNVTLIVNNACGSDTVTYAVLVNCALPQAVFSYQTNGLTANFYGVSPNAFTYSWTFGDGGIAGNFPIPTHAYTLSGTYNVCLTASNACGSDTKCDSVLVCTAPSANTFTLTANATNVTATYVGQGTSTVFNFNDGFATNLNPCGSDTVCKNINLFCSSGIPPQICMVSVDSLSQHNVIYWDKTAYLSSDTFFVYREITSNNYQIVGKVPYDSLSMFVDTVHTQYLPNTGDPNFSSYKYKMAVMDSCGNLSAMGLYHETMFLQDQLNGNFNWNHYGIEGASTPIPQLTDYLLARDNNIDGIFETPIGTTTSNLAVDGAYFTFQNTADWRLFTNWTIVCNPTLKTGQSLFAVVKSRSNVKNNRTTGISTAPKLDGISLYPNPNNGTLHVDLKHYQKATIEIHNALGEIAYKNELSANLNTLDVSGLKPGVYFVQINTEIGRSIYKIVKE
jgi:PKD repeat protein